MSVRAHNNADSGVDHQEDLVEKQARLSVQVQVREQNDKTKEDTTNNELKSSKTVRTGMSNGISKLKGKEVILNNDANSKSNKIKRCNVNIKNKESSDDNDAKQCSEGDEKEDAIYNRKESTVNKKSKPVKIDSTTNSEFTNVPKNKCKKNNGKGIATKKKLRVVQDQEIPVKKQSSLTDHFQVRRSERRLKTIEDDERKMALQKQILSGFEDGLEIRVLEEKGRGVFSSKKFNKGDFVCEYAGELIDVQEARMREAEYEETPEVGSYMYFFEFKSKKYCVDATKESDRLGRLLNHSKISSNVSTQLFPINEIPYLILVASQDIEPGEELLYDYGDRSKKSVESHPWLKC